MKQYLISTNMLDYEHDSITKLVLQRGWKNLDAYHKIQSIYNYVRDEIKFGYSTDDVIPASKVLGDGYGQCNTKSTLFMALLRAVSIPCRTHGFIIDKGLQRGAMPEWVYKKSPSDLLHSWTEVFYDGGWCDMEGIILDKPYLKKLQKMFPDCRGVFCGYGASVGDLNNPPIDWDANSTYIQKETIKKDLGLFDSPDDLFMQHAQQLSGLKKLFYKYVARHAMNRCVKRIRR